MTRKAEIDGWAEQQPWDQIGVVIIAGWMPYAIEVVRKIRGPMADIIVFDPDDAGEDGEGYWRVQLLDSVRLKLGHRRWPFLDVAILMPPEMQGPERFDPLVRMLDGLIEGYGDDLGVAGVAMLQSAKVDVDRLLAGLKEKHRSYIHDLHDYARQGEQFAQCQHLTMLTNVEKWTEIGLDLLPDYADKTPVQALKGMAAGRDGLIVGAGPSLNQAMFWLPAVQDRIVICATEAACPVLERGGVRPDVVVAVEAQASAYEGLEGLSLWDDAILVPGVHASPKCWELPAKQIMPAIQSIGPLGSWLCENLDIQTLEAGGSVATVAYSILDILGCDVICGVGIDSAYGPESNMRAYAEGVRGGEGKRKRPVCHERLPAWGGHGVVASSPQLKTYRNWYALMARQHKERQHINLSVGGARIDGWHEMELKDWHDAVLEHCEPAGRINPPFQPIDLAWSIEALSEQLEGIRYIEDTAQEAIDVTNRFVEAMTKLGKLPSVQSTKLVGSLQHSPLHIMRRLPGQDHMATANHVNKRLLEVCAKFAPLLERCIERMKQRYARAA
jgi:hypothetical protein